MSAEKKDELRETAQAQCASRQLVNIQRGQGEWPAYIVTATTIVVRTTARMP